MSVPRGVKKEIWIKVGFKLQCEHINTIITKVLMTEKQSVLF